MTDVATIPHEAAEQIRAHLEGGPGHRRGPWVLVDMETWASVCECGIRTVVPNDVLRTTAWASKEERPLTFGFEEGRRMNEMQARAVDIGIRAISGATHYTTRQNEVEILLDARRTLEGMLSEGFLPCRECGRPPTPFAMLGEDGWCAVCRCTRNNVYGRSLDDVREEWNKELEEDE